MWNMLGLQGASSPYKGESSRYYTTIASVKSEGYKDTFIHAVIMKVYSGNNDQKYTGCLLDSVQSDLYCVI